MSLVTSVLFAMYILNLKKGRRQKEHKVMTEFAHAVNFTMSFGVTVLPEDINEMRERLEKYPDEYYSIHHIELTKDSTDEEIANYLGLQNYRDWMLAECTEMEMDEHHVYDKEDTERLIKQYQDTLKAYQEANATTGVDG